MELPSPDQPQIPSGEYQGLPEPPGAEPPLGGVDPMQAMRWTLGFLMSNRFQNPADQGPQAGDTMGYPEVN